MMQSLPRRQFLRRTAVAGAAASLGFPSILHAQNKGDKLRLAMIGVGGIGGSHTGMAHKAGDHVVCCAEVDSNNLKNVKQDGRWPGATVYSDYREMFDKEAKNFDAVMIGTPDHHHYPATVLALNHGKHCYVQKPLTHTMWEAKQLADYATRAKVATQMGNQGHANEGNRVIYEYVRNGLLGEIPEIHCWTNRPVWPQGITKPQGEDPIPANLNWDAWIGPAPMRAFKAGVYHTFKWRGWWDFGGGALADMACHTTDCVFWSMDPGHPTSVELVDVEKANDDTFPSKSHIKFTFPAKDWRPGFVMHWYDGGWKPPRPKDLAEGKEIPNTGNYFMGSKATLQVTGDYGDSPRIVPEERHKEIGKPARILERSPGHYEEWRLASLGQKPITFPGSNFSYSAPFSSIILLGNVALKAGKGEKLAWDGQNLRFTNNASMNQHLTKPYRQGWDFKLEV
jgi:predicted dehydrogenase